MLIASAGLSSFVHAAREHRGRAVHPLGIRRTWRHGGWMDWVNQFLHPCTCDVHTRGLARIARQMGSASGPRPPDPAVALVNTVTRPTRLDQPQHAEHPDWVRLGRVHPPIHEQPFTPSVRDRPGPIHGLAVSSVRDDAGQLQNHRFGTRHHLIGMAFRSPLGTSRLHACWRRGPVRQFGGKRRFPGVVPYRIPAGVSGCR